MAVYVGSVLCTVQCDPQVHNAILSAHTVQYSTWAGIARFFLVYAPRAPLGKVPRLILSLSVRTSAL
jgi:hypothetical protein